MGMFSTPFIIKYQLKKLKGFLMKVLQDYIILQNASHKNYSVKVPVDSIARTVDNIGSAFMRQMVAGDMPEVITVGDMSVQMAQIPENADEDDAGFKLPNLMSVLKNQSESLFKSGRVVSVGAMVCLNANAILLHHEK